MTNLNPLRDLCRRLKLQLDELSPKPADLARKAERDHLVRERQDLLLKLKKQLAEL